MLIPLLLGITFITFSLAKALPGDPVYSMVGERASPEIIEKIRTELGADKGILRQYGGYLQLLARGELGRSYYTNRRVAEDIAIKAPQTFKLAFAAMLIAVPAGLLLGLSAALSRRRWVDRAISGLTISGLSLPVFWSGLMLMFLLSLKLKLLPPSGTGGLQFVLLPAMTLSLPALASLARVTRVAVLDIRAMPYIRTARAKGLGDLRIISAHVMRNALIPVITVIGLDFGSYLSGAVLTETIFGWDGIGRFAMEGIIKRDYPVIMGCILVSTLCFVLVNMMVDLLYQYLDPRLRKR
ncbi:MAG: peptide ABC transporter permease [Thermodesulfovibrio sp.]|nr:peptide ABC transporter permease [Thermodesulfovibrio sp.]